MHRTRKLLDADQTVRAFMGAKSWIDVWWGLVEWSEPQTFQGPDDALTALASSLGPFRLLRFSHGAARADPVLSTEELRRLVLGLLELVERLLTVRHFDHVFRSLFAYAYVAEVPLDQAEEPATHELSPIDGMVADEIAREVLVQLSDRQLSILIDRIQEKQTLDQLAERYQVSRGTVDNELRRAMTMIGEAVDQDADIELVLEKLAAMAF